MPELGLDERREGREDRRALRSVAPQLAQRRAGGTPPRPNRPGPRPTLSNQVTGLKRTSAAPMRAARSLPAELARHRPDEVAEREVGEDRRDLDQVADAAEEVADAADEPQDVQVAGRVVVEERGGRRTRTGPACGEVARPRTGTTARSTPKPEPGRRYAMMSRKASPRRQQDEDAAARRPRTRSAMAPPCPGRAHRLRGHSRRDRSPASDEVLGSVAEGAAGSRPLGCPGRLGRSPARTPHRGGLIAAALAAYWLPGQRPLLQPLRVAGARVPARPAAIDYPVNAGGFPYGNDWMQDIYPLSELTGDPTTTGALLPFPPLPGDRARAVRRGLGPRDRHPGGLRAGRRGRRRRSRGGRSAGCPISRRDPARDDDLLRVRDGPLVCGPAGHDVVLRPRRRGRRSCCSARSAWRSARTAARTPRSTSRRPSPPLARVGLRRSCGGRCPCSTGGRSSPGCCSGWPARRDCRSSSGRRSSCSSGAAARGCGGRFSAGLGTAIPVGLLLLYNVATTGHVFHPGYDWQYQREATGYPTLNYNPDWGIEDPRYLVAEPRDHVPARRPRSRPSWRPARSATASPCCTDPGATRGLFDRDLPARRAAARSA